MNGLISLLEQWFKEALIGGIISSFEDMFVEVNDKVGDIAVQVGASPDQWNSEIFSMIKSLSDTVVIPIAGMILTFVLTYELIQMIISPNNLSSFETWVFFKWIFKTFVAVYLVTHTFDIVMGVFGLVQYVIDGSAGIITGNLDASVALDTLEETLLEMQWYELIGVYLQALIISFAMNALSICIFIIVYGRMLEIYLTTSVAAIPLATMANKEWGQIGNNYLKSLFAIAFQGFLIIVCVAIYAVLLESAATNENVMSAIWGVMGYTVLLCYALFKTGSLAKSIFNAA